MNKTHQSDRDELFSLALHLLGRLEDHAWEAGFDGFSLTIQMARCELQFGPWNEIGIGVEPSAPVTVTAGVWAVVELLTELRAATSERSGRIALCMAFTWIDVGVDDLDREVERLIEVRRWEDG